MNEKRIKHCLLGIASLTHGLMVAADGNEELTSLADKFSALCLMGGIELEKVSIANELETQEMLPVEIDQRAS